MQRDSEHYWLVVTPSIHRTLVAISINSLHTPIFWRVLTRLKQCATVYSESVFVVAYGYTTKSDAFVVVVKSGLNTFVA
jgi:hypothetical protein